MFSMSIATTPSRAGIAARVSEEIRVLLLRRRMTQAQLADRLQVPQPWISRRLTLTVPMTLDDVDRVAEALDVSVWELLGTGVRRPTDGYVRRLMHFAGRIYRRASVPRYMPTSRFALAA